MGSPEHNGEEQSAPKQTRQPLPRRLYGYVRNHPLKSLVIAVAVLAAIAAGVYLWFYFQSYVSTDDAQVDGYLNPVSSRINGTVKYVLFEDNQAIRKGQVLVKLDQRDYHVAVEQAEAAYAQAKNETFAQAPNVPITRTSTATSLATSEAAVAGAEAAVSAAERDYQAALADLRQAEANNAQAQLQVERYRGLIKKDEVSKERFDQLKATAKADAALVDARRASAEAVRKIVIQRKQSLQEAQKRLSEVRKNMPHQISIQRATVAARKAGAEAAKARLDMARLDLSYTIIRAPVSGIAGNRSVDVGQRLQVGQQLLMITQIDNLWVKANFKETGIRNMHPGLKATIHVDALGRDFEGYVESMPGATGAKYSLLPPENATGNYVKVVQRLPVRIRFNQGQPGLERLRPGMSVEPKVWLK